MIRYGKFGHPRTLTSLAWLEVPGLRSILHAKAFAAVTGTHAPLRVSAQHFWKLLDAARCPLGRHNLLWAISKGALECILQFMKQVDCIPSDYYQIFAVTLS